MPNQPPKPSFTPDQVKLILQEAKKIREESSDNLESSQLITLGQDMDLPEAVLEKALTRLKASGEISRNVSLRPRRKLWPIAAAAFAGVALLAAVMVHSCQSYIDVNNPAPRGGPPPASGRP